MEEMEDVPDVAEEMHGPDAAGVLQFGVDPVGRPDPGEEPRGRVGPVDRPAPEAAKGMEGPRKKLKPKDPKGGKRPGESIDKLGCGEPARRGEVVQALANPGGESSGSGGANASVSQPAGDAASSLSIFDIASIVEEHVCKGAEQEACVNIAKEPYALGATSSDVAEIFSPQRFTSRANQFGLRPGLAVDLSVPKDSQGSAGIFHGKTTSKSCSEGCGRRDQRF